VGEAPAADIAHPLAAAARSAGFTPTLSVIEITGTCANCREG
jgi:Fur family zinc uptake transcriptional regulator